VIDIETSPPTPGAANPKGVGERIWRACKIILINVIVFCSLFVLFELSYRVWTYFRSCNSICNITALTKLDAFEREHVYGFLASNSVTGFSPADGTFVIHEPEWNNATITIHGGVRVNTNFAPTSADGAILAVGDSFVFGDQVSDGETWPAILEKRLNRRVVNGGVSNYGAAQAVLRAEQLLKAEPYTLVMLSILVGAELELWRDRLVNVFVFYRPAVIRESGEVRQTTIEESRKIVRDNFICDHPGIPEFFFWSYVARRFFSRLGYDGQCSAIVHPKAATVNEILEFVVDRLARFPVNKAILIQYPSYSFKNTSEAANIYEAAIRESIDQARMIREVANRHGVPVVDTYNVLKNEPLDKIYRSPHYSKKGNEVVADLIAREIPMLVNGQSNH
jgi:lysophospholipase L1-like esterase